MNSAYPLWLALVGLFVHQLVQPQVAASNDIDVAFGALIDDDILDGFAAAHADGFIDNGFQW